MEQFMATAGEIIFRYAGPVALTVAGCQAVKKRGLKVPAWLGAVILSGFFSVSGLAADGLFAKPAAVIGGTIAQTWGAVYIFATIFYSAVWKGLRARFGSGAK